MNKVLPTERLTSVLAEATTHAEALHHLRRVVSQCLRDWGIMPQEAIMAELREALDQANSAQLGAIPEALAYLQLNSRRLEASRNAQRKRRGLPPRDYDPLAHLPREGQAPSPSAPTLSLDDIEEKLKELQYEE